MNSKDTSDVAAVVFVLIVFLAGILGWSMNLFKLAVSDFESPYKVEVVRTVGVFVPFVGAITGYMDIGEEHK